MTHRHQRVRHPGDVLNVIPPTHVPHPAPTQASAWSPPEKGATDNVLGRRPGHTWLVAESIFDELSPDDRREVMRRAKRSSFKAREVIFREGDLGNTVHWIESGLVAVRSTSALGDTVTFVMLGPGDTFGEFALILPESARSASVVAVSATRTLALQRNDFEELRSTHPNADHILMVALARTVQHLSSRIIEAHFVAADKRVVRRVAELAEAFGDTSLPLTQDDLAALAGTTRQTVNKVLRECEEAGVVKLSRGTVTIIDGAQLAKRAR